MIPDISYVIDHIYTYDCVPSIFKETVRIVLINTFSLYWSVFVVVKVKVTRRQ